MSLSQPHHFRDFEQLILSWKSSYRYASLSSLALNTTDGQVLLFGRIILEFSQPEEFQSFRLEAGDLIARIDGLPISEDAIDKITTEVAQGIISFGDEVFSLKCNGDFWSSFSPIYHPAITAGPRLPAVAVSGIAKNGLLQRENFKLLEHFDWALKSADQPFDTLDELLIFMGLPRILQMSDMTTLELVARSPIVIRDTSRVENNEAIVICRLAEGLDPSLVKLGFKVANKQSPTRSFVSGENLSWKKEGDFQDGTVQIPVGDMPVLQAFVSYAGHAIHQWWVTDPKKSLNIRKAAYEPYDNNLEVIKRFLAALGNNKSEDFETGVSLLLYLLGFSVAHMGTTKLLSEGPDILASTPSGNLIGY